MPRIVTWDEFCAMPSGTVFSEYEPHIVSGLFVRHDIIKSIDDGKPSDFFYTNIAAESSGPDDELGVCWQQRDGTYDYRDFVVYDEEDVRKMVEALTGVKHGARATNNWPYDNRFAGDVYHEAWPNLIINPVAANQLNEQTSPEWKESAARVIERSVKQDG